MVQNLPQAEGYAHQKGIYPAREAILLQQQNRGAKNASVDNIFIGNGTSELIDMCLRALLSDGDEVLVPSPDYPLWTAAVTLNGGRAVHYSCRPENQFHPDPDEVEALITPRTRALVIINPNNPTGAVYPRAVLERLARIAEKHQLVVLSDEIYDGITYDNVPFVPIASLVTDTLCATLSGFVQGVSRSRLSRGLGQFHRRGASTPRITWRHWNCCAPCTCAATCRRNGPCKAHWAATRAFST